MKLQTIALLGVGLYLIYKLGQKINGKNQSQPVLIKKQEPVPVPPAPISQTPVVSTTLPAGVIISNFSPVPAGRAIFPESMVQSFNINGSGETTKTYEASNLVK